MKRSLSIFVMLLLAILVACGDSDDTTSNASSKEDTEEKDSGETENKEEKADSKDEKESEDQKIPVVTKESMVRAYEIINDYDSVKASDVEVSKENQKINLTIAVDAATNGKYAKELGDNFARVLSSGVSKDADMDLESPSSKDDLGELYDYYDLHVDIGTGPDNLIAQGAMVTSSPKITW